MDNNSNTIPLCVLLEQAKSAMYGALEKTINQTKLPAYLMEGIIFELLANVQSQKNIEIINELNIIKQQEGENEHTTGNNA